MHCTVFLWSTYPIANNFRLMAEGRLDSGRRFEPGTGSQECLSSWTRSATKSGIHIKQSHMMSGCRMIWFSVQRRKQALERGSCLGVPTATGAAITGGPRAGAGRRLLSERGPRCSPGGTRADVSEGNTNKLVKCACMKFSCWKIHSIKTFIPYSLLSANPAQTH